MSITCVIPARGGSKGIPRKNLQHVGGLPLIDRAILAVVQSGVASAIFVSTEDSEIASRAIACGAELIQRPESLATDEISSENVLLHALETTGIQEGRLLFVQTTTPLLEPDDLRSLVSSTEGFDSSLTVTESHAFVWRESNDGRLSGVNHDPLVRQRRQEISKREYLENGAAYLMSVNGFLRMRHRFFGRIGFSVMPRIRSIEIDSPEDLLLVNQIYATLNSHR
jgi:CMP-N-acetylneuraminic acid synthetase